MTWSWSAFAPLSWRAHFVLNRATVEAQTLLTTRKSSLQDEAWWLCSFLATAMSCHPTLRFFSRWSQHTFGSWTGVIPWWTTCPASFSQREWKALKNKHQRRICPSPAACTRTLAPLLSWSATAVHQGTCTLVCQNDWSKQTKPNTAKVFQLHLTIIYPTQTRWGKRSFGRR